MNGDPSGWQVVAQDALFVVLILGILFIWSKW
jgi:hypothetical protein